MGLFLFGDNMIKDFIGVFPNAFSQNFCDRVINHFDYCRTNTAFVRPRLESEGVDPLYKDDHSFFLNDPDLQEYLEVKELPFLHKKFGEEFFSTTSRFLDEYNAEYSILRRINTEVGPKSGVFDLKIQKTDPGEGYHTWHCESFDRHSMFRYIAYTVYLNTVDEGGETEFLYQKQRLKPEAGTLAIWPAAWTHVHRGNPPLSGSKYIITTWEEFV